MRAVAKKARNVIYLRDNYSALGTPACAIRTGALAQVHTHFGGEFYRDDGGRCGFSA
jgi:hypothetical protein